MGLHQDSNYDVAFARVAQPPIIYSSYVHNSHIKNSPTKGISITDTEIIFSHLADDTTLFLENAFQIPISIQTTCFHQSLDCVSEEMLAVSCNAMIH